MCSLMLWSESSLILGVMLQSVFVFYYSPGLIEIFQQKKTAIASLNVLETCHHRPLHTPLETSSKFSPCVLHHSESRVRTESPSKKRSSPKWPTQRSDKADACPLLPSTCTVSVGWDGRENASLHFLELIRCWDEIFLRCEIPSAVSIPAVRALTGLWLFLHDASDPLWLVRDSRLDVLLSEASVFTVVILNRDVTGDTKLWRTAETDFHGVISCSRASSQAFFF